MPKKSLRREVEEESGQAKTRFSLKRPVEESAGLIAVHNLKESDLRSALKLGGLPMPSIAVVKANAGHEKYGPISLIFDKTSIDPEADARNKVYGGDGYTPTAPSVDYRIDRGVLTKTEKRISELSGEIAGGIFKNTSSLRSRGIEDSTSTTEDELIGRLADDYTVKAAYLADKGETLEPQRTAKVFDSFGNNALQAYIDSIGAQGLKAIVDEMDEAGSDYDIAEREMPGVREVMREVWKNKHALSLSKSTPEKAAARLENMLDNKLYVVRVADFMRHAWEYYQDGGKTTEQIDRGATQAALDEATDTNDIKAWLKEELAGLYGEPGIYNGKDLYTESGSSRSFEQLHYAYTLENIVKAMRETQPARGGQTWGATAKSLQATATPSYKDIASVKNDSRRLGKVEGEEYETAVKTVDKVIDTVINEIMKKNKPHSSNSFEEMDIIASIMMHAADSAKTVDAIVRAYKKEGYAITNDIAQTIQGIYKAAAELPTEYFEAKPERAVGFDEVKAAVLPTGQMDDLRSELSSAGVQVLEYDPSVDGDRVRVLNSEPVNSIKFELRRKSKPFNPIEEKDYNNWGWPYRNGILSGAENSAMFHKWSDFKAGRNNGEFQMSNDGEYIIPVGEKTGVNNVFVFVEDDNGEPSINRVVRVDLHNATDLAELEDLIYENDGRENWDSATEIMENYFGSVSVKDVTKSDMPNYQEFSARNGSRDAGSSSGRADTDNRDKQGRGRNAQKDGRGGKEKFSLRRASKKLNIELIDVVFSVYPIFRFAQGFEALHRRWVIDNTCVL